MACLLEHGPLSIHMASMINIFAAVRCKLTRLWPVCCSMSPHHSSP
jgi:hypothetical protein